MCAYIHTDLHTDIPTDIHTVSSSESKSVHIHTDLHTHTHTHTHSQVTPRFSFIGKPISEALSSMGINPETLIKIRREGRNTGGALLGPSAPALVFPAWAQAGPTPAAPAVLPGSVMTYPQNYPVQTQNGSARVSVDSRHPSEGHGHHHGVSVPRNFRQPPKDGRQRRSLRYLPRAAS
jgi:hypothetical protein